jgi:arylsulfatase A-like enzyme
MITRRAFLASTAAMPGYFAAPQSRPNVLFIAIDDLNDWIGCLGGHPDIRTPHLDRLAASGVNFTNAHCAAPLCNPSRASLMTGIRPSTSGVYDNPQPMRRSPVLANAVTLSQHFRAAGYSATGAGKIYHGAFPDPQSWDDYFPSQGPYRSPDPAPAKLPANGIPKAANFDWAPLEVEDSAMGDYKVAEWTRQQLSRRHDKPFFLACGLYRPHLPWFVPRKYFEMYPLDKITLPEVNENDLDDIPEAGRRMAKPDGDHASVLKHNQWRHAVQAYLASITFADAMVGRVMEALDQSPHAADTTVVLWSDHGWHLGEKLHWRKFALWEEATHNVLMVRAPGITRPGGRCARPVNLLDIYPTLVDTAHLPKRKELEGRSLLPLLKNPSARWPFPTLTTYGQNNHSVRDERWRYIRYADGSEELYDRNKDPLEWTNLAARKDLEGEKRRLARSLPTVNAEPTPREKTGPGIWDD